MLTVASPRPLTCSQGSSSNLLTHIHDAELALVIWHRPAEPNIIQELAQLCAEDFPDVRTEIHGDKTGELISQLIAMQGFDAEAAFPAWLADMAALCEIFISLAAGRPVTARLETLARTGCPRFHVDRSYLRLVCTYRGPGTEWLDDAQVDRRAQASGAPNETIVRSGMPSRMPTFAVGLMKGSRYPGCANTGLVHRSPAVDPGDPARVLFCLDC